MNAKKLSKIGYGLLIAFLVLIGGLLIFSMVPIEGNFQIKIVLSGSMEPEIKVGSVVIVKPVDRYEVGDVVTFGKDDRDNIPTTHRILDVRVVDGEMRFITKGDANEDRDGRELTADGIIGKVLFDIPYLGFILDMAKKPLGFAILIGIPAVIIVSDEFRKIWKEARRIRDKKRITHTKDSNEDDSDDENSTKE